MKYIIIIIIIIIILWEISWILIVKLLASDLLTQQFNIILLKF